MNFGKTLLTTLFATSIVIANVTAAKLSFFTIPVIGGVAVPAGFVAIAASFLFSDLLAELYGKADARNVVNATILSLAFGWGLIYVSLLLPTAPFYAHAAAFSTIMGSGAIIVFSGVVTMLVSQNIDVALFHRIGEVTQYRFARNIGSTAVSQLVDTALFIGLAFVVFPAVVGSGAVSLLVAAQMIVGQYVVKLIVALGDTPLFYAVTSVREVRA